MTADPRYQAIDVNVRGGTLHVGHWQSTTDHTGPPAVLAVHGVTANHLAWLSLADQYPHDIIAPDLRGRGRSGDLPGPAGMDTHSDDLIAVIDQLGLDRVIVAGHSMGGFVVTTFARAHPNRISGVLLIDGGLPLPDPPPEMSADEAIAATIGPAAQRLEMTFADADDYLNFWRDHPALSPAWSDNIEAYLTYELVGDPPACRSSVSLERVREDSRDLLDKTSVQARAHALPSGTVFLRAENGMMGQPGGLYPVDLINRHAKTYPQLRIRTVPDVNHYTLVMAPPGARTVAATLAEYAG